MTVPLPPAPEPARPKSPQTIPLQTGIAPAAAESAAAFAPAAGEPQSVTPNPSPAQARPSGAQPQVQPAPVRSAQAAPPSAVTPPKPAAPRLAAPPAPSVIEIEINRGTLIRLPRPAATVFVANPEIADVQVKEKSPSFVYLTAKKGGETTLIAVDGDDRLLLESRVVVAHNLARLRDGIKQLAPSRQVEVSSMSGQLVLDGIVASPTESEDIRRMAAATTGDEKLVINRLRIAAPIQVNLRVRVVELTKDMSKQLGFNWAVAGNIAGVQIGFAVVNPNTSSIANKLAVHFANSSVDVNLVVDAMDQDGLLKVLAQPNLTAISGQTASFLVGGEFPIIVPQGQGTFTVEFKKFGVSLAFSPTVLNDNRINLHVRPEVSDLTQNGAVQISGFTIPGLATRRAETTVEVASGQSFAIAGLLRDDIVHSITKWPGLGDIPILGTLFRSDKFQRKESELVIIVTPYVVEPVSTSLLATPVDGFRAPHDLERIFYGAQWRRDMLPGDTGPELQKRARLAGPAGFQLE